LSPSSPFSQPPKRSISLDGSRGEGGGQILRTALTLSLLTGQPFRLSRIRANRPKPGLRPQHLKAVEVAAALSNAKVVGAEVDSRQLTFEPGEINVEDLDIDIGTAGSTGLVLQTIHLPIAMRTDRRVRVQLRGGTFNPKAPAYTFLDETWRPFLHSFGLELSLAMPQAGFYPRGGGTLVAEIEPGQPRSHTRTTRGTLIRVRGVAGVANLPEHVANRMIARATSLLTERTQFDASSTSFEKIRWPSLGPGAAITLIAEYEGNVPSTFVGFGERGKPAEDVADEAVDQLLAFDAIRDAAVEPHAADQILVPLALAEGKSSYTVSAVSEHLRTNIATIGAFLDRSITVEEGDGPGEPGIVTID